MGNICLTRRAAATKGSGRTTRFTLVSQSTSASSQMKFVRKKRSFGTLQAPINEKISTTSIPVRAYSRITRRLFCVVRSSSEQSTA